MQEEVIAFDELVSELGIAIKSFKIEVKKTVKEVLVKLNKQEQEAVLHAIYQLPEGEIKKLSHVEGLYSLKVDDFRIIYSAQEDVITVILLKRE